MEVGVTVFRHVIVENNIDSFDIHATTKEIGSHENSLLEILKLLVSGQSGRESTKSLDNLSNKLIDNEIPFFLSHSAVNGDGGEILFHK